MKKLKKPGRAMAVLIGAALLLSGCAMVSGAGKDLQSASDAVEKEI